MAGRHQSSLPRVVMVVLCRQLCRTERQQRGYYREPTAKSLAAACLISEEEGNEGKDVASGELLSRKEQAEYCGFFCQIGQADILDGRPRIST